MGTSVPVELDGHHLSREDVVRIARDGVEVTLSPSALDRVEVAADYVARLAERGDVVYGVTTGFGKNSDVLLPDAAAAIQLQENLIISHAVCVGDPLPSELVRAILVIRINTLLQGHSGIRRETLELLTGMLNRGVHPIVPEKGSCGASGDLAPLSHVGLVLIGRGEAEYEGEVIPGARALERAGLESVCLTYKEGLALNNTTAFMCGLGVFALQRLRHLLRIADVAAALALEAHAGRSAAFVASVHDLRPHPGQVAVADNIRRLIQGSELVDLDPECIPRPDGDWDVDPRGQLVGGKSWSPQDSYSLRCVPQVHGAVRDAVDHACAVFDRELSAVTDNPILFPEDDVVISAGNFHGMPLALALSAVKTAIPALAGIAERRLAKMVDAATSDGLPFFLVDNRDSIQSGFMIIQYTAASLVNELATRAHPASVYSVPTCANVEDHVSMGANEARHVLDMIDDLERVLALELLGSAQALDLRRKLLRGELGGKPRTPEAQARQAANRKADPAPGPATSRVLARIRQDVPYLTVDRALRHDIRRLEELVRGADLLAAAESEAGNLH